VIEGYEIHIFMSHISSSMSRVLWSGTCYIRLCT